MMSSFRVWEILSLYSFSIVVAAEYVKYLYYLQKYASYVYKKSPAKGSLFVDFS